MGNYSAINLTVQLSQTNSWGNIKCQNWNKNKSHVVNSQTLIKMEMVIKNIFFLTLLSSPSMKKKKKPLYQLKTYCFSAPNPPLIVSLCDTGAGPCKHFLFASWHNVRLTECYGGTLKEEEASLHLHVLIPLLWLQYHSVPTSKFQWHSHGGILVSSTSCPLGSFPVPCTSTRGLYSASSAGSPADLSRTFTGDSEKTSC